MKSKIYLSIPFFLFVLLSCKKETYKQAQQFGTIRFDNQSGLVGLKLSYNNDLYTNGGLNNVKIPSGKGNFSFIDPATNKSLLDTSLTIEANSVQDLVLFKPSEDAKLILLRNNQQDEPKPEPGLMKVKIADLASKAFPKSVDIVFYALDEEIFDYVPIDTLQNVPKQFQDGYVVLRTTTSVNDPYLYAKFLDSETQEPLNDAFIPIDSIDPNTYLPLSVFTIFIRDDKDGLPINGTSDKVSIGVLFKN
jgi:hypothetical protein